MNVTVPEPTVLRIEGLQDASQLKKHLTYRDLKADHDYQRAKHSPYMKHQMGEEAYFEHLADLKKEIQKCLLKEELNGDFTTLSGLARRVSNLLKLNFPNRTFPEPDIIPWAKVPEKQMRYYQEKTVELLLEAGHGAVELATGAGKSICILHLTKRLGLQTVVMAPSVSIARQLHSEFEFHFGKKYVGLFGDGKKDFKKKFVIAISASLAKVEEGSPAWEALSKAPVLIVDESHLVAAKTLFAVCTGLLRSASYRFFVSATQMRNDGADLVLEGIVGEILYRKDVKELVEEGFLARPEFRMIKCKSTEDFWSKDSIAMSRQHLLRNKEVAKIAADIANKGISLQGKPTVILIDEVSQFANILPHLKHEVGFCHGGVNADNRDSVPKMYHDSDPTRLVAEFNDGKRQLLVGTSCITTGTDIRPVKQIIYIQGGTSEIKVRQAIGRGTRMVPGKDSCHFYDFDVSNIETTARHAEARRAIYDSVYPSLKEI